MDDYTEFLDNPCRVCGSVEYRYYGGGYNCREGHRNDALCEQVAEDDDIDFSRSRMMRNSQLSQSKMTAQTSRVAAKKWSKRSGKGDHDVNSRYGITAEEQAALFLEERRRFSRKGDVRRFVLMEAFMQLLIHQICAIKKINEFWVNFSVEVKHQKQQLFEELCRNIFKAYLNEIDFPYSHTDADHPELNVNNNTQSHQILDDLDRELFLDDYDYENETPVTDSESDEFEMDQPPARNENCHSTKSASLTSTNYPFKSENFPYKKSPPFGNAFSTLNPVLIAYLALLHVDVPILFCDLARALERGDIPGYRPDFLLSKDIVTVRLNINELRTFHTRQLPSTSQLYYNSKLILQMISRQCRVPDWSITESNFDGLLEKLMKEMVLPPFYFPFIKSHVNRVIKNLKFLILTDEHIYVTPCAIISAAILFFLRLLYSLHGLKSEDAVDEVGEALKKFHLPTQEDLVREWDARIDSLELFADEDVIDEAVEDPERFDELLSIANKLVTPTCIVDSSASIKGIFGDSFVDQVKSSPVPTHKKLKDPSWMKTRYDPKIVLPTQNYSRYLRYPDGIIVDSIANPYKIALLLIHKLVGISADDTERIIKIVFETETTTTIDTLVIACYSKKKKRLFNEPVFVYY